MQNQPAAVLIPVGAPPNDGTVGFLQALPEQVLSGLLGNSTTAATSVLLATDIGKLYGLTKDATTLEWYVDKAKTTTAAGACVQITDLMSPVGTLNGRVGFVVTAAAQQIY